MTTVPNEDSAILISEALVKEGLAACVSRFAVRSMYIWEGKLENADEVQLVIKTCNDLVPLLKEHVKKLHPFEVPEAIVVDIADGSAQYLGWLRSLCRNP